MSSVAIVMTLCCISVDRYIAVTRSTRYKSIVTVKRACYALIVVWGQGLLYASFPLFGWSKYEYHPGTLHCSPDWSEHCSLYIYLAVVGFGVPIIVMVFTYIRIFFVIRKHSRKVSTVRRVSKTVNNACARNMTPMTRRSVNRGRSLLPEQSAENFRKNYDVVGTSTKKEMRSQDACEIFSDSLELASFECGTRQANTNDLVSHDPETRLHEPSRTSCTDREFVGPQNPNKKSQYKSQWSNHGKMRVEKILKRIHSNMRPRNHLLSQLPREYKVAKTGVLLLVSFVILWLPYMVVHVCSAKVNAPPVVFRLSSWLVFMNGVANPILYALCNTTVKLKFKQAISHFCALCCKCRRKEKDANFRKSGKNI